MKIHPMVAELFSVDKQEDMTKLLVAFFAILCMCVKMNSGTNIFRTGTWIQRKFVVPCD